MTPLALADGEIEAMLQPYLGERMALDDPRWRALVAEEESRRRIAGRYWLKRLFGWARGAGRGDSVEADYDRIWAEADFARLIDPAQQRMPHEWRGEGLMLNAGATQRLHLALMVRALRHARPRSVLEVGSGWGLNLMVLAGQSPETSFHGVELTANGVALTRKLAQGDDLPAPLRAMLPAPPTDPSAFRRVQVERGSAERLPFADGAFDLVFTRLALEQMESIRAAALAEIARVARAHVMLIESFVEENDVGLRRRYAIANGYFRGRISDLPGHGLEPVFTYAAWPHKITLKPVFVLASKKANA